MIKKIFIAVFLFFLITENLFAYLDPGTGTYILQIVMAALLAGLVGIKMFWRKIKSIFNMIFKKDKKNQEDE